MNLLSAVVGVLENIRLPQAKHRVSTLQHIGVLGLVESHSFPLPLVWFWKPRRVAMPIIAVELDNQPVQREHGIYDELSRNRRLLFIETTHAVQQRIPHPLGFGGGHLLLFYVHRKKHLSPQGVSVSALQGTIRHVVSVLSGWRPTERLATYLADIGILVPSLPNRSTILGAKAGGGDTHLWHIKLLTAGFTIDSLAVLAILMPTFS